MISAAVSLEKDLHKKERGGGLQGSFYLIAVVNNIRSPVVKKAQKRPLYFHWSVNVCTDAVNSPRHNPSISTGVWIRQFVTTKLVN
jgi:hypothetical protein